MVNKVILVGRLGKDPELKTTSSASVCTFSVATTDRRKDKETDGDYKEHTEWHNIVTFHKVAKNCAEYLKKGKLVYIEGKIQTDSFEDENGVRKYYTKIIANTVQFLGGKNEESAPGEQAQSRSKATYNNEVNNGIGESVSFDDDDIPF